MKLLRYMSICSLLSSSLAIHAMEEWRQQEELKLQQEMAEWKEREARKEKWEAQNPGEYYNECGVGRSLKPGYVFDESGHAVPSSQLISTKALMHTKTYSQTDEESGRVGLPKDTPVGNIKMKGYARTHSPTHEQE